MHATKIFSFMILFFNISKKKLIKKNMYAKIIYT